MSDDVVKREMERLDELLQDFFRRKTQALPAPPPDAPKPPPDPRDPEASKEEEP